MDFAKPKELTKGHLGKDKKLRSEIGKTSKLYKDFDKNLKNNTLL